METRAHRFGRWSVWQVVEWEGEAFPYTTIFPDISIEELKAASPDGAAGRVTDSGMIVMANQLFALKRDDGLTAIVEFGTGNDKARPDQPYWDHQSLPYAGALESIGSSPADVRFAFLNHGHLDHVGWASSLVDGRWQPTFPNAEYVLDREEWNYFDSLKRDDPAWIPSTDDSLRPVVEAGLARWVADGEVVAGLRAHSAPGHTPGMTLFELDGENVWFVSDILHHTSQISHPDWRALNFDWNADLAASQRRSLWRRLAGTGAVIFGMHTGNPFRIVRSGDTFAFESIPERVGP